MPDDFRRSFDVVGGLVTYTSDAHLNRTLTENQRQEQRLDETMALREISEASIRTRH